MKYWWILIWRSQARLPKQPNLIPRQTFWLYSMLQQRFDCPLCGIHDIPNVGMAADTCGIGSCIYIYMVHLLWDNGMHHCSALWDIVNFISCRLTPQTEMEIIRNKQLLSQMDVQQVADYLTLRNKMQIMSCKFRLDCSLNLLVWKPMLKCLRLNASREIFYKKLMRVS